MTMGKSAASNTYNAASSSGGGGAHSTSAASSFSSSHNNDPSDNKHEQRLQAVLLADTFSNAFHPITLEPYYPVDAAIIHTDDASKKGTSAATTTAISDRRPLILCPINNVPLLHHTINFLQGNGVEELLILVALGAEALEEYIRCHAEGSSSSGGGGGGGGSGGGGMKSNASNYNSNNEVGGSSSGAIAWSSKLVISIVRITDCTNAGDALRELDRRNVIKSDPFILMQGDVVTNVDLHEAMICHSKRKKKDASAIMTVLLKDVGGWGLDDDDDDDDDVVHDGGGVGEENDMRNEEKKEEHDGRSQVPRSTTTTSIAHGSSNSFLPPLRSSTDDLLLALDTTHSNRILLWDSHPQNANVSLPSIFFHENSSNITVTRNYLDVGIDICSPDVLARFSDEFDYRELREQFVANCVSEEESGLQSARIYAHILNTSSGEYAGRPLGDMRLYHQVSMDLLRRWCYPLVPDNGGGGGGGGGGSSGNQSKSASYVRERHFIYRDVMSTTKVGACAGAGAEASSNHNRSHLGRSTQLFGPLLLGPNNSIGERCLLRRSVLGPNCTILDDCSIVDCHLWGNALVEEGAVLEGVIVCEGAIIRKGAFVERGCVVGRGCIIGEGVRLREFTRITSAAEVNDDDDDDYSGFSDNSSSEEDSEDDDEDNDDNGNEESKSKEAATGTSSTSSNITTNHDIVGKDGYGRRYIPAPSDDYDSDDDDEEAVAAAIELMKSQSIGYDMKLVYQKWKKLQMDDEDDGFSLDERDSDEEDSMMYMDDEWTNDDAAVTNMRSSVSNSHLGDDGMQIAGRQKGVDVVKELRDICLEHETSTPVENLRIELNSFKFSQNATYADCCTGAIMAVMEKILEELAGDGVPTPGKLVGSLKKMLGYWGALFHSICMGVEEEKAIIVALETMALGPAEGKAASALMQEPAFRFVLQTLHDKEIVNEEAIFAWSSERKGEGKDSPLGSLFWQKPTQDFLEWLEDEDGSSDEDDDGDSDSD